MELEKNKEYLLEQNSYSKYPTINKIKVVDVTKTCYKLKYDNSNEIWIEKNRIVEDTPYSFQYKMKEKL